MKYRLKYFYFATGMDKPDERELGVVEAGSPEEAKRLGLKGDESDFYKSCVEAHLVKDPIDPLPVIKKWLELCHDTGQSPLGNNPHPVKLWIMWSITRNPYEIELLFDAFASMGIVSPELQSSTVVCSVSRLDK